MSLELHAVLRLIHIVCGTGSFVLGGVVALLPKFGRKASWHRLLGRIYAVCMLVMASLSVPLAWNRQNWLLFVIGLLTLAAIGIGWRAIRVAKSLRDAGAVARRQNLIGAHITMMASSYIAAWTAFFVANHPLGNHGIGLLLAYWFGPSIVGVPLLVRSRRRYQALMQRTASSPPATAEGIGGAMP